MDWTECSKKDLAKKIKPDKDLASALIIASSKKLKSEELLALDETTAESKVSLAYDSLRELLEAIAVTKGYKIYNHECFCAFLKEILKESYLGDRFNKVRKTRNDINYYGKSMSTKEAESIIKEIKELIRELKTKFLYK